MSQDSIVGTAKNLSGKVQQGVGYVVGDTETQVYGLADQAAGAAQDLYGQAKESAADAAGAIRQGAVDADDYVRQIVEQRPYTTVLVALCIGWVIGRMGRI